MEEIEEIPAACDVLRFSAGEFVRASIHRRVRGFCEQMREVKKVGLTNIRDTDEFQSDPLLSFATNVCPSQRNVFWETVLQVSATISDTFELMAQQWFTNYQMTSDD